MLTLMAKSPKKPAPKPAGIFFRPDAETDAALRTFIESQPVPPTTAAVALRALKLFLKSYPPPKK